MSESENGANVPDVSDVAERWARIDRLDLEPMVFKLTTAEEEGERLSLEVADEAVGLYRGFLKLCVRYPGKAIVPNRVIDRVWHAHMVDTAKYREDCLRIAGRPLDHWPYSGTMGPQDEAQLRDDFAVTRELFFEHFRIDLAAGSAADCGQGCGPCQGEPPNLASRERPRPDRSLVGADAG
ncbi:hypothetical protein OHR68_00045 [Spirillospora sp. NBC_00431]